MKKINNLTKLPLEFIDDPKFKSKLRTKYLGAAAGSEKLYINIDYVKPGGKSVKYHSHSHQEEFFAILKGSGLLRFNEEELQVNINDFFAKPAGQGIAHQFINNSDDILIILDCGTKSDNDEIYYPDEDVTYKKKEKQAFRSGKLIQNWSSDPNE
jgi:uncharacterized cupin superfamily protein